MVSTIGAFLFSILDGQFVSVCKLAMCVCVDSAQNKMFKCLYVVMKTKCNEASARVYATYFEKMSARMLASINCAIG